VGRGGGGVRPALVLLLSICARPGCHRDCDCDCAKGVEIAAVARSPRAPGLGLAPGVRTATSEAWGHVRLLVLEPDSILPLFFNQDAANAPCPLCTEIVSLKTALESQGGCFYADGFFLCSFLSLFRSGEVHGSCAVIEFESGFRACTYSNFNPVEISCLYIRGSSSDPGGCGYRPRGLETGGLTASISIMQLIFVQAGSSNEASHISFHSLQCVAFEIYEGLNVVLYPRWADNSCTVPFFVRLIVDRVAVHLRRRRCQSLLYNRSVLIQIQLNERVVMTKLYGGKKVVPHPLNISSPLLQHRRQLAMS